MRPSDMYPPGYSYNTAEGVAPAYNARTASGLLLSRVSFLTLGMVLCTAFGAYVFSLIGNPVLLLPAVIALFVMMFVCQAVSRKFPLNLLALAVFAGLEGMVLSPLLMYYAHLHGPMIIIQAAMLSAIIFAMVGTLGYTSTRSYAHWVPWLIGAVFLMMLVGLVGMFVAFTPGMNWLFAVFGMILFTAFTFVDFTRIRHDFGPEDYIFATMKVYLDLITMFQYVLMLLGGSDRRR